MLDISYGGNSVQGTAYAEAGRAQKPGRGWEATWSSATAGSRLYHLGFGKDNGVIRSQEPGWPGRAGPWQEMLSEEMQAPNNPKIEEGG